MSSKNCTFLVLIDNSSEMPTALKFACLRANSCGGRVALAHVLEDSIGGENWLSVTELAKAQAREDAEKLMEKHGNTVIRYTGHMPTFFIREGNTPEEIAKLIDEESSISILVLASSTSQTNPGPVINYFLRKGVGCMRIPITIVPGDISDSVLEDLT